MLWDEFLGAVLELAQQLERVCPHPKRLAFKEASLCAREATVAPSTAATAAIAAIGRSALVAAAPDLCRWRRRRSESERRGATGVRCLNQLA